MEPPVLDETCVFYHCAKQEGREIAPALLNICRLSLVLSALINPETIPVPFGDTETGRYSSPPSVDMPRCRRPSHEPDRSSHSTGSGYRRPRLPGTGSSDRWLPWDSGPRKDRNAGRKHPSPGSSVFRLLAPDTASGPEVRLPPRALPRHRAFPEAPVQSGAPYPDPVHPAGRERFDPSGNARR